MPPAETVAPCNSNSPGASAARVMLLTLAATALAMALQFHNGRLDPFGLAFMAAGLIACGLALPLSSSGLPVTPDGKTVERSVWVAVALVMAAQFIRPPGIYLDVHGYLARVPFLAGIAAAGALPLFALRSSRPATRGRLRLALLGLLALHVMLGAWVVRHSPHPIIDVVVFQRDSVAAILAGHNPYTLTFPNIYEDGSDFYGPGMSVGGRLQFGFPYPPLSLLLAVPGTVLGGDFRYSQLLAMTGSGALIALARGGPLGLAAAALYLFSPRSFFVLEQGWTEPYLVALLALVVFFACRFRAGLGVAIGLLLASKQYLILAVPLIPLLRPPEQRSGAPCRWAVSVAAPAIAVASVLTLPFVLWDPSAFIHDVVALQFQQPFRDDALTFLAAFAYLTGIQLPSSCAFLAAALASWLAWRRCPRTPAGFATATAFVFFSFFAFNKQAFCNYYSFVVGALCVALGAWRQQSDRGC